MREPAPAATIPIEDNERCIGAEALGTEPPLRAREVACSSSADRLPSDEMLSSNEDRWYSSAAGLVAGGSRCYLFASSDERRTLVLFGDAPFWFVVAAPLQATKDLLRQAGELDTARMSTLPPALRGVGRCLRNAAGALSQVREDADLVTVNPGHVETAAVLEITRRCQLRCRHCYARGGSPRADELPLADWLRIVDELPDLGWRPDRARVNIIGGEPLLREDTAALAVHVHRRGYRARLFTNALLVRLSDTAWLRNCCVEACVSVDGSEETHDALRGRGTYRRTMEAVRALLEAGVRVRLNCCVHRENLHAIPKMLSTAVEIGVQGINFDDLLFIGRATGGSLRRVPRRELYRALFDTARGAPATAALLATSQFARTVAHVRDGWRRDAVGPVVGPSFYVASNGDVYGGVDSVDITDLRLGSIRFATLSTIYEQALRSAWLQPRSIDALNPTCSRCPVRYYCGGDQRGEHFAYTSSLATPHFKCREIAESIIELMWIISEKPDFLQAPEPSPRGSTTGLGADRGVMA